MVKYLETTKCKGDYYLQYFINNVLTIEKLGDSKKELGSKNFSTQNIRVHYRD